MNPRMPDPYIERSNLCLCLFLNVFVALETDSKRETNEEKKGREKKQRQIVNSFLILCEAEIPT